MDLNKTQILRTAYRALNTPYRILAPANEARITYPEFSPFRAVQVITIVEWPGITSCSDNTLNFKHVIRDGDAL